MLVQPVTINLPVPLYDRLKRRAEQAHSTVEDEMLQAVAATVPLAEELDPELNEALSPLTLLDDKALWQAARSHLSKESAAHLEALHLKRQREGLTEEEKQTLRVYMKQYERAMLVRAQSAVLLQQRGYDVSELLSAK